MSRRHYSTQKRKNYIENQLNNWQNCFVIVRLNIPKIFCFQSLVTLGYLCFKATKSGPNTTYTQKQVSCQYLIQNPSPVCQLKAGYKECSSPVLFASSSIPLKALKAYRVDQPLAWNRTLPLISSNNSILVFTEQQTKFRRRRSYWQICSLCWLTRQLWWGWWSL